jgi:two-component system sensor histidine kinase/response regulator
MINTTSSRAVVNCTIAAGLGVLLMIAALIMVSFAEVQRQTSQMEIARSVAAHVSEMRFTVIETILYNEPRPAEQWQNKMATMQKVLSSPPFDHAEDNEALERIRANFGLLDVLYQRLRESNMVRMAENDDEDANRHQEIVARTMSAMLVATQEMGNQAFELARSNQRRAEFALKATQWCVGLGLGVLVLLLLGLRKVVDRRILTPIAAVQRGTEQIAAGNLSFRFKQPGPDEIGLLAGRFNEMSMQLERSHKALTQEIDERKIAQQQALDANEELVKAVARADAASHAKSEFLANMSHEIRTPLNGILGMTQLTLRTDLTSTQREYLSIVRDSGASLLRVINDTLDFSKMEAGKLELINQTFDVRERVAACLRSFMSAVSEKRLELALRVAAEVPPAVSGDADRVIQILVNLVGNAIKFTDSGEVLVNVSCASTTPSGVTLQFDVHDSGIGIDPAQQHRVFDMFAQADSSITRQYGGTGLGLSICLQLVRMMDGELWLDSTPGAGSVFHFTIRFAHAALPDEAISGAALPFSKLAVLVVDDNATMRRILDEQLRARGIVPVLCESGAAALQHLSLQAVRGTPFAMVLLDDRMPAMNGIDVAERICADTAYGNPRIVMLSSDGRSDTGDRHLPNVVRWLHKPMTENELVRAMHAALSSQIHKPVPAGVPDALPSAEPPVRSLKLLLVEDQPINRKLASTVLSKRGHEITLASTGLEAITQFRKGRFDAILMDIQMPEMDGYRAAEAIRTIEQERGNRARIIAVTAHALEREHRRCIEAGMDSVLIKPYLPEQLLAAVEGAAPDRARPVIREPSEEADGSVETVFDQQAALRRVLGKRRILCQMATMFINDAPAAVHRMRNAIDGSDPGKLMQEAHRIKGSAGIFGAAAVMDYAIALEEMGRGGALDGAPAQLEQFETELGRLAAALQDMVMREAA